ncbi:MAG: SDR family NAD(P)-dependent oxidoreductase, partial [Actinomycetota bacterium]
MSTEPNSGSDRADRAERPSLADPAAEFAGRIAIVTGSSSGIGEEIARRLSAGGATVVVNS